MESVPLALMVVLIVLQLLLALHVLFQLPLLQMELAIAKMDITSSLLIK
jgi:hypothetical protein